MPSRLELLQGVPLFAQLDAEGLAEIERTTEETRVAEGAVLMREGRQEGSFFIIVDGRVRIERGGRTINVLGPGDFFGELALLDGGPRTASATAEAPTHLLTMRFDRFQQVLDDLPQVQAAVTNAAERYLRRIDDESPA